MARMARRFRLVGLMALTLHGVGAEAAEAQARGAGGAGAVFFGAGVSGTGTAELDGRLAERGYPTFRRTALAVNLGAYRILPGGLLLSGEWHGLVFGEEMHEGREVGLGGGYGTLGLGYAVDLSPRTRVYPRIGIGGGGMGLWIESDDGRAGFDEVLANPDTEVLLNRQAVVLSHGGVVLDIGAGAELMPAGRGRGPLIGLRVGYLTMPVGTGWQLKEYSVADGPDASIAGPYVRVVVGGGWTRD